MIEESGPTGTADEREVAELWTSLRREIRRRGVDSETADDLAQETWLRTLRAPPERDGRGLGGWLHVVGVRLVSEYRRSSRNRVAREQRVARREEVCDHEDGESRIQRLVQELPSPYREVVHLRFYENLDLGEIAQRLGRSPVTVRSQLARGLQRLRVRLGEEDRDWRRALLAFLALERGASFARRLQVASVAVGLLGLGLWFALGREARPEPELARAASAGAWLSEVGDGRAAREAAAEPRGSGASEPARPAGEARALRRLEGTVRTNDGQPVPGAALRVGGRAGDGRTLGHSDAQGRYALEGLAPEDFLWVETDEARPSRRLYLASLAAEARHDFFLPEDRGVLEVRLIEPDGRPAAGLEVVVDDEVGRAEQSVVSASGGLELVPHATLRATSDADGRARLPHPTRSLLEFRVRRAGTLVHHAVHEVAAEADRFELRLGPSPRLVGRLLGPDGAALADTTFQVRQRNDQVFRNVRTDARGAFELDGLVAGEVTVQAMLPGSRCAVEVTTELVAGEVRELVLQASAAQAISGVAREAAGPLGGAEVALFREGRHALEAEHVVRCGEDGSFVLSAVEGVDYWLELRRPGVALPVGVERHVRAGEQRALTVDPALEERAELVLDFRAAQAAHVPARIKLRMAQPRITLEAEVDADGRATLALPRGEYELAAWVPGVGYWRASERFVPGRGPYEVLVPAPGRVEVVLDVPPGPAARVFLRVGGLNPFGFDSLGAVSTDVLLAGDASGRYFSGELFPGRVGYFARVEGHTECSGRVAVPAGDRVELRLAPRPARPLTLTLELPRELAAGEALTLEARTPSGLVELPTGADAERSGTRLEFVLQVPLDASELLARTSGGLSAAKVLSPGESEAGQRPRLVLR